MVRDEFEDEILERTEDINRYYQLQETREVKSGVEKMLSSPIPYIKYGDVDYDPESRILLVEVVARSSEIKKAKNLGKFSEVKTMINRAIGGSISPFILSTNIRLIIDLKYRNLIFKNKERILDCEIHNKRFDFMKHTGT